MTKTPEEIAVDWANAEGDLWFADISTYTDGHKSAVKQGFLAGYQAAKLEWISVKDRLPEDGVEVLVVSDGETGASWHEAGEFGWAIGGTVTHWAPLPKPPEE